MGNESYGGGGNYRGGGNQRRNNYPVSSGDPAKDENAKRKYSDSLRDPNAIDYNKDTGMPKEKQDPFFDSMRDKDNYRGGNRGRNSRGGGYYRGGRGGRPNNYADPKKDAETYGESTAENFKLNHEAEPRRGGRGSRGGKGADRGQANRERRGGGPDHYQNALS